MEMQGIIQLVVVVITSFVAGRLLGWHNARLLQRLDRRLEVAGNSRTIGRMT